MLDHVTGGRIVELVVSFVVGGGPVSPLSSSDVLHVGVEDGKVCVVLFQHPGRSPLDREVTDGIRAGFSVGTAEDLDVISVEVKPGQILMYYVRLGSSDRGLCLPQVISINRV